MSHFRHKPVNLLVSGLVVVGVMAISFSAASARAGHHAVHNASGNVTFSDQQFIDTLNPFQVGTVVDTESTALIQGGGNLSLWGPNSKYMFLESSTPAVSNHGKTYKFTIHKNMKWSNGDPITAADFVYSWKLGMNPNTGVCTGTCDNIASISYKGLNVTVHMKAPYAPALSNAIGAVGFQDSRWTVKGKITKGDLTSCLNASASNSFKGCDNAANAYEDKTVNYLDKSFVTAGPYQVSSYDSTSGQIQFSINPNYTSSMPGGKPKIASMTFLPYGNVAGLIAGAANGQTDVTQDYTLGNVGDSSHPGTLKYYHNFKTLVNSNADPEVLTFNQKNATTNIDSGSGTAATGAHNPFVGKSGKWVRLALLMSFNRQTMIQNAFAPLDASTAASLVSYCAPIICTKSGHAPYADKSIKGAWDPIKNKYVAGQCGASKSNGGDGSGSTAVKDAKAALKKAGYSSKHPLVIYLSSTTKPYRYFEQAYLQKCWTALGSFITVNTENIKSAHYFAPWANDGTLAKGRFEADLHGYGGVPPDPDGWKGNFLGKNCPQLAPNTASQANIDCFNDSVINNSLYKAGKAFNNATRQKWYSVFQEEVTKQGDWGLMAPLPKIITWDGTPAHGLVNDPWVAPQTWDAYGWT